MVLLPYLPLEATVGLWILEQPLHGPGSADTLAHEAKELRVILGFHTFYAVVVLEGAILILTHIYS